MQLLEPRLKIRRLLKILHDHDVEELTETTTVRTARGTLVLLQRRFREARQVLIARDVTRDHRTKRIRTDHFLPPIESLLNRRHWKSAYDLPFFRFFAYWNQAF